MGLEKKFKLYLDDFEDIISEEGTYSDVYKVYSGKKAYCGKMPKGTYNFATNGLDDADYDYLDMVTESMEYEAFIAKKIFDLGYAPKPEGVFDVEVVNSEGIYLPGFVNSFDPSLIDFDKAKEIYGKEKIENLRDDAFRTLLKKGFSFHEDSYLHPGNILYSPKQGIKLLDYGWIKYNELSNPFPSLCVRDEDEIKRDNSKIEEFTEGLRSKLL